ncbi:uncharacterized protein Z520_02708 [Fonsecaea multimorphosa CBS 102226]|uniref:Uncharacterized protein n=1 Tax=Fonsecaea multimorphosa CBS 102226 TaxID=1442371 RepID=A0A0D2HGV5_9EURO|nr:uncharacterized protein Z520_02708 [Fonsecaea multimorphosa CBS 102226]KIY01156.1 hypothetical protein Z520_02708 [Fonsecaea multimorphosa CBS 102226]
MDGIYKVHKQEGQDQHKRPFTEEKFSAQNVATMDSSHIRGNQQPRAVPTARSEEVATEPADPLLEKPVKSSSKKRAKARKDREGLQALLNRSMQAKSTPSLNLMDLMKK